jgi:hypothetical protein
MLDYEKLDVYRIALKFVVTTVEIRDRLPRGNGELQDQFKRASFAIESKAGENGVSPLLHYVSEQTPIPQFYQVHGGSKGFTVTDAIKVLGFVDFVKEVGLV